RLDLRAAQLDPRLEGLQDLVVVQGAPVGGQGAALALGLGGHGGGESINRPAAFPPPFPEAEKPHRPCPNRNPPDPRGGRQLIAKYRKAQQPKRLRSTICRPLPGTGGATAPLRPMEKRALSLLPDLFLQKTVARPVSVAGVGIHSGRTVQLKLSPAP